jgi:hypothetical protein
VWLEASTGVDLVDVRVHGYVASTASPVLVRSMRRRSPPRRTT